MRPSRIRSSADDVRLTSMRRRTFFASCAFENSALSLLVDERPELSKKHVYRLEMSHDVRAHLHFGYISTLRMSECFNQCEAEHLVVSDFYELFFRDSFF